jgi:hypothetical protein
MALAIPATYNRGATAIVQCRLGVEALALREVRAGP